MSPVLVSVTDCHRDLNFVFWDQFPLSAASKLTFPAEFAIDGIGALVAADNGNDHFLRSGTSPSTFCEVLAGGGDHCDLELLS